MISPSGVMVGEALVTTGTLVEGVGWLVGGTAVCAAVGVGFGVGWTAGEVLVGVAVGVALGAGGVGARSPTSA